MTAQIGSSAFPKLRRLWQTLSIMALLAFTIIQMGQVQSAQALDHRTYFPMPMSSEGQMYDTSAYFGALREKYGLEWPDFATRASSEEEVALKEIISAILRRDLGYIRSVAAQDLVNGDPKKFTEYMEGFFGLWPAVEGVGVDQQLQFGNEFIFVLEGTWRGKAVRPLVRFHYPPNGELVYIPYGKDNIGSTLVSLWAIRAARDPEAVKGRSLTKLNLRKGHGEAYQYVSAGGRFPPLSVVFEGTRPTSKMKNPIITHYRQMQRLLRQGNEEEFLAGYTKKSAEYIRRELSAMSAAARDQYVERFASQKPVFLISADPFYVLYAQNHLVPGTVEIVYLIHRPAGGYAITNADTRTILDQLFAGEAFGKAALEEIPFESMKVRGSCEALTEGH